MSFLQSFTVRAKENVSAPAADLTIDRSQRQTNVTVPYS